MGLPGGMVTGQIEPCIRFNVQNGGRASVPRKSIIVRAAKYEVLDFGFHAVDSGFPIIGLTWIQDFNRLGDSGVLELDFKRKTFWNSESLLPYIGRIFFVMTSANG